MDDRIQNLLTEAKSGRIVWYTDIKDAEKVQSLGGDNWDIEKDENGKIKYNRTAIIVLKNNDRYLLVRGNKWTTTVNNRPVITFKIGDNKELIRIHRKDSSGNPQYMIPNLYGFVKGSIEDLEDDVVAARRELHEETGLVLPYSSFREVEYFSKNNDPRANPVFTINITDKQRDAITRELNERNDRDEGEIFGHNWVTFYEIENFKLNSNSKDVYKRIISKRPVRGGKTRRSIKNKRRRTNKKTYTK